MKINDLKDLNNLRSAPNLNDSESLRMLNQIDKKILKSDWITIGIMASSDKLAKETLNSIIQKYDYKFFKNFEKIYADGNVFLKANQKSGEVYIRSENGLGEGILLTCQYNDLSIHSKTYGPFPLNLFCR
tara:strand:+ start:1009 stop:1398 length:390 start_codon:yes stop_codon:yes gene_type:complete